MEKQQLKKDLDELLAELNKVKTNEKKVKQELQDERLKISFALQNALLQSQNVMTQQPAQLGYQSFLSKQQARGETGVITGKVGMQSKFMDYSKLNTNNSNNLGVSAA